MVEEIYRLKVQQAVDLLSDSDFDLWLVFVRETSLTPDPALSLIYPYGLTWKSAFLISQDGQAMAVVGKFDGDNVRRIGAFNQVIEYTESIRDALEEALNQLGPSRIGVNSSRNDPAADGLTTGMHQVLVDLIHEVGLDDTELVSAEVLNGRLRSRKLGMEVELIQAAVHQTEELLDEVGQEIKPGISERQLSQYLHDRVDDLGLGFAWERVFNPIVNTGPDSSIGHSAPGDLVVEPGHLVHFDFGVKKDGYCADLQRMWYVLEPSQAAPPEEVMHVWNGVRAALLAGAAALKPGAMGWQVDDAARETLVQAGLPEYKHAFGHHIGRSAHDGATVLGPRWERYGRSPYGVIEAGNCFAIELGARVEGRGWVYLEENVCVTEDGLQWLSRPQTEIWTLAPA